MRSHVHVVPGERVEAHGLHHLLTAAGLDARLGHTHADDTPCGGAVVLWALDGADAQLSALRDALGRVPVLLVLEEEEQLEQVQRSTWAGAPTVVATSGTVSFVSAVRGFVSGAPAVRHSDPVPIGPRLTRRESEIARLVAAGWRTDEIADELGISPHTVRTHTQSLRLKLGVQHRLALVAKLAFNGTAPPPPYHRPSTAVADLGGGRPPA